MKIRYLPLVIVLAAVLHAPAVLAADPASAEDIPQFSVYKDSHSPDNHYLPSGWFGDVSDITLDVKSKASPHSGLTCIRIDYSAAKSLGLGWAGIYWQYPQNNWGSMPGGYDLQRMNRLTFWARGEKGGEMIQKFMVGGIRGEYPDSVLAQTGIVRLTADWQQYTINLAGKDLSRLSGGFGWAATTEYNPQGVVFYLDDIRFEGGPRTGSELRPQEEMPFYVYHEQASLMNHFILSGWMGDQKAVTVDSGYGQNPFRGKTCMKIAYDPHKNSSERWVGAYWQEPADNWGYWDSGYDLSRARYLIFWARGEKGGERIDKFTVGGIVGGKYPDTATAQIGPIVLEREWQKYTINLKGEDLTRISGGFAWAINSDMNPQGATFFLDEIHFE